jgi:hypothetical protein
MDSLHTHFVGSARAIIDTAVAANRYSRLPVLITSIFVEQFRGHGLHEDVRQWIGISFGMLDIFIYTFFTGRVGAVLVESRHSLLQ